MNTAQPAIELDVAAGSVRLSGSWNLAALAAAGDRLERELTSLDGSRAWDCRDVATMDSAGAMRLWHVWNRALPARLEARPEHLRMFERIAAATRAPTISVPASPVEGLVVLGRWALNLRRNLTDFVVLLGCLPADLLHLARYPGELPWREITANLYKSGARAMPVTALVGFLIGVVLSYLSALQLRQVGADIFIINILGIGIVRELGPVLTAVLVAGRSGSAMTAQLGVMRVTEEIDALATMGVSRTLRLVLPKIIALSLAVPLLVLWTTLLALVGGMLSAALQLDISVDFFIDVLPKVVPLANLWIAQAKGFVFGLVVALVACHYGLRVQPNTESLSVNTTSSVVISITAVILIDAIFAIATRGVGVGGF